MAADEEQPEPGDAEGHGEAQDAGDSDTAADLQREAEREARPLLDGPTVSMFGGEVPARLLIALALFVTVFMLVWAALWALLGGFGLGLGWILAGLIAGMAVLLVNRSFWSQPRDGRIGSSRS